ncbi:MAG: hypothetical protein DRP59_10015 [Spirochaetes bacterium]|nr:MAG: hypothetical protein DRP59_10015 [Spirochaetota bacterium]
MIWILISGAIIILALLNGTPILYRENPAYSVLEKREYLCEESAPFHVTTGSDNLVLFVHGFPSTPAVYRWAAEELSKEGWDCAAPLLPGFGTDWHDLLSTNFSQWYAYLSDYYREMRNSYRKVFIVGTSMGGSLTLKLAEEYSGTSLAPDGIVTIAAPVFVNKIFFYGIVKNPAYYLVRTIGWFIKSRQAQNITSPGKNDIDGRGRWRGYSGVFPVQTYSLKIGLKEINRDLKKITIPHLIVHDRKDRTVPFLNCFHIAKKVNSSNLELMVTNIGKINHEHHSLLIYDSTRKIVLDRIREFISGTVS